MNYHKIENYDLVNGKGVRVTLFVSGCNHGCRGCYNKSTWNPKSGKPFDERVQNDLLRMLGDPRIRGLSLSGGDPLHERNLSDIRKLIERVRRELPDKDIWMWTGYKFEDLDPVRREIVNMVDVLIDGKFEENNPTNKPFRGSDNQRLIEVKNVT